MGNCFIPFMSNIFQLLGGAKPLVLRQAIEQPTMSKHQTLCLLSAFQVMCGTGFDLLNMLNIRERRTNPSEFQRAYCDKCLLVQRKLQHLP